MIKLSDLLDDVIVEMTVKAMLDPNNEYFYLPRLTLEKCEELCAGNEEKTRIFWKCYHIAENKFSEEKQLNKMFEPKHVQECDSETVCPECNYYRYIKGCRCPNCDFIE